MQTIIFLSEVDLEESRAMKCCPLPFACTDQRQILYSLEAFDPIRDQRWQPFRKLRPPCCSVITSHGWTNVTFRLYEFMLITTKWKYKWEGIYDASGFRLTRDLNFTSRTEKRIWFWQTFKLIQLASLFSFIGCLHLGSRPYRPDASLCPL